MSVTKRFVRFLAVLATLVGVSFGTMAVNATAASAADGGYGINMASACHLKYGGLHQTMDAWYQDPANPYTWYCKRKISDSTGGSFSASTDKSLTASAEWGSEWQIIGGVDTQLYCSTYHPGTKAYVSNYYAPMWNAYNWKCGAPGNGGGGW